MTSLLPPSRALSHQLASRASQLGGVPRSCPNPWSRVVYNNAGLLSTLLQSNDSTPLLSQLLYRSYATKPGKPKAHTGRVAASKRKPAVARSDAAAGVPKKAPAKKAPAKTKRATTTRKPAAKKPGRKAKLKPRTKPAPKRKVLTEKQKAAKEKKQASEKKKDLRKIALLDAPKQLPSTAYIVLSVESSGKGMSVTQHAKDVSAQYKTLSPEEMERLNHVAHENKAKNDVAYKKWLSEHTPAEIKAANVARNQLKKQAKLAGIKKGFNHIQDERLVRRPRMPFNYFLTDRFASGDMKHMKLGEVGALVSREWKALSTAEKKPFEDRAAKDKARYVDEYTTVYGTAPPFMTGKAASKST